MDRLETSPTGANDRPTKDIVINEIVVFVDPFEEFQKERKEKEEEERAKEQKKKEETDDQRTTWTGKRLRDDGKPERGSSGGVGKYLKAAKLQPAEQGDEIVEAVDEPYFEESVKKKIKPSGGFGNFDAW